jgi:hypothetical protein
VALDLFTVSTAAVGALRREEPSMADPAKIASAQILQEVQSEAVRQGYDTPVCTYFETLYSPRELIDGKHGPIAGWLLLLEATAPLGRPPVRLYATVKLVSGSRHIEIGAQR